MLQLSALTVEAVDVRQTYVFKGPFDIVANIGSITKPENETTHHVVLQV